MEKPINTNSQKKIVELILWANDHFPQIIEATLIFYLYIFVFVICLAILRNSETYNHFQNEIIGLKWWLLK
jgi:hypothetical protein